ncbi:MAG: class IV adenylate cyclase [Armatimonadetes bacterium]|nr:class IV adenylate cyclase [Armatimonadota bacterium]
MRNVELKCRCADLELVRRRAEELGARAAGVLEQEDWFFPAPLARLKLRCFPDGAAELISYSRPDHPDVRSSDYHLYPTGNPEGLTAVLAKALGNAGVVRKRRRLYLFQNTRIHLDEVEGLGNFVELETVVHGQPEADAYRELQTVAEALELREEDRIATAYRDLLPPA